MLWEVEEDTLTCLAQPTEHDDLVLSLDINADNTKVVSAGQDCRWVVDANNKHFERCAQLKTPLPIRFK